MYTPIANTRYFHPNNTSNRSNSIKYTLSMSVSLSISRGSNFTNAVSLYYRFILQVDFDPCTDYRMIFISKFIVNTLLVSMQTGQTVTKIKVKSLESRNDRFE
jgi:hypothetical protein